LPGNKSTNLNPYLNKLVNLGTGKLFWHLRSFSIYRPAESGKPLLIATISQDTAMPVGEPRGYSIKAFRAEENNLWLATDFGLFSFDLGKKQWQNRFTGRNLSYLKDIAVTEE
jgi:hypothetical protein